MLANAICEWKRIRNTKSFQKNILDGKKNILDVKKYSGRQNKNKSQVNPKGQPEGQLNHHLGIMINYKYRWEHICKSRFNDQCKYRYYYDKKNEEG